MTSKQLRLLLAPLLVLALLVGFSAGAAAQVGKGWFWVDFLRVDNDANIMGNATITGNVTAATVRAGTVTATGTITAATAVVSGAVTAASVTASGAVAASTLATSGNATLGNDVTVTSDLTTGDNVTVGNFLYLTAGTPISLTDGGIITATNTYQPIDAAPGSTVTMTVAAGASGQALRLLNRGTASILIVDTGTAKLASDYTLGQYDSLLLISDGTNMIELGRSNN